MTEHRTRKRFGQHFLHDAEIIDAGVSGAAHVMEYRRAVGTKG